MDNADKIFILNENNENLLEKIKAKKALVGIIGLGYVGLPLALTFCESGFVITGFDIDEDKVNKLREQSSYITTVESKRIIANSEYFHPTSCFHLLKNMDVIIITVPTPLNEYRQPDLSYIQKAVEQILENRAKKKQLIILESTSYPGTTREQIYDVLQQSAGGIIGQDYYVAFSPERENPGSCTPIKQIPKLVSGITNECLEMVKTLYEQVFDQVVPTTSTEVAECAKILENTYRAVNIALINEMRYLCEQMGINVWEVVEAAATKPFGFQKFTPGFVGGHCLDEKSKLFLVENEEYKIVDFGPYVNSLNCLKEIIGDTEFFYPKDTKCLSFNMQDKSTSYERVCCFSKRKFMGNMIDVRCHYGYNLRVTDLHPMLVVENGNIRIKFAKDITSEDYLVLNKKLSNLTQLPSNIDILECLDSSTFSKIRVKLKTGSFKQYKDIIKKACKNTRITINYFTSDYLPLEEYLKMEKDLNISRTNLYLCRGRGPSFSKFPCVVFWDEDLARLIGYYLSEGCVMNNKESLKTAFTFNSNELEYIEDVISILKNKFELSPLGYKDKNFQATSVKVPSFFLGFLFKNILKCGRNCYEKQIPSIFYNAPPNLKIQLLKGLFRGDGGSHVCSGKHTYFKNEKIYTHNCASASINYFTSSPVLFQQIGLFLKDFDLIPKLQKRPGLLQLSSFKDIEKAKEFFGEIRKNTFEAYFKNHQKDIKYNYIKDYDDFYSLKVKKVNIEPVDTFVYSAEISNNHTIVTTNGLIVHNCISTDPSYLAYRVKKFECKSRLISEAEAINWGQPKYIATKICEILGRYVLLQGSNVLVLGVTYKPNVDDIRESGVLRLMDYLEEKGVVVDYNDPYIPKLQRKGKFFKEQTSYMITPCGDIMEDFDAVIIAVNHSCYDYQYIVKYSKRVIDIVNATKEIQSDKILRI